MGCPNCGNRNPAKASPWAREEVTPSGRRGLRILGSQCLVCGCKWEHTETAVFREFDTHPREVSAADLGLPP